VPAAGVVTAAGAGVHAWCPAVARVETPIHTELDTLVYAYASARDTYTTKGRGQEGRQGKEQGGGERGGFMDKRTPRTRSSQ
jgi:hypothetical protein